VDVIVVGRDFLFKNEEVVRQVVEAYFRANYDLSDKAAMVQGATIEAGDCANPCSGWVVCCLGPSRRDIRCEANRFKARHRLSFSMKESILDARSPEHVGR
jgi:hypothetical protein